MALAQYSSALFGLLAPALVLASGQPSLAEATMCDFQAYSDDKDPAGTNVRAGPGTNYDIVGVLMPEAIDDSYTFTPGFDVIASDSGWFKIGDAVAGQYADEIERVVFEGPGWVSAKLVKFEIEDWHLRAGPTFDADVTLEMDPSTPWSMDNIQVTDVHACAGRFVEVTLSNLAGDSKRGWVTDLCGSQVTTCP